MASAREFILGAGGIDSVNQFTKTFLALFGVRGWEDIGEIPCLIFLEALPLNYRQFSQWVIPHLIPMAYLRHNRVSRKIRGTFGPALDLSELYARDPWQPSGVEMAPSAWYDGFMVKKLLQQQRKHGSWGGYTVSTLFSIAALDRFFRKPPRRFPTNPGAIKQGLEFVDDLYFDYGKGNYLGCLMDGGVWDTILSAQALAQAGETSAPLALAAEKLYDVQTAEGGFPYGTFTIPVARRVGGTVTTFDIEPTMVERTRERAAVAGACNVQYVVRDVFADGFGGEAGSQDACLLFNILHCEEPVRLLAEAARVVRPGGAVLVIHWRCDPPTPRGPSMDIRPQPGRIAEWAAGTGLLAAEGQAIDLPPWHYGWRLRRSGAMRGGPARPKG